MTEGFELYDKIVQLKFPAEDNKIMEKTVPMIKFCQKMMANCHHPLKIEEITIKIII